MDKDFPRAIVHFDGDSFFASVEQALDWRLKGKPVVTGAERGAATALSYEAKRKGARRGMTMRQIKELVPDVIVVPSNYTAYSIYAHRMYRIVRQHAFVVEEYSIDECFADITGLDVRYGKSYEEIALMIKEQLENDLGITFGVGLAPSKTLAKVASSHRKPGGFTSIPMEAIPQFLKDFPMSSVWGVGFSTSLSMERHGVFTALDFVSKDRAWLLEKRISKPYQEIWSELAGKSVKGIASDEISAIGSIIKSHTFRPTRDRAFILSQLAKNLEAACAKARRHHTKSRLCRFYLKTQSFTYAALMLELPVALADPRAFLRAINDRFDDIYEPGQTYRATGIGLYGLIREDAVTPDLFGKFAESEHALPVLSAIDRMNQKYGKNTLYLGASQDAIADETMRSRARVPRTRTSPILTVEKRKKTISIPYLGTVR